MKLRGRVILFFVTKKKSKYEFLHFYNRSTKSQVYPLMVGSKTIPAYCHMGNFGCGDGGWTPVMKIDGVKVRFFIIFTPSLLGLCVCSFVFYFSKS